jgi:nucleoside-diphosphate-sugar epimerase
MVDPISPILIAGAGDVGLAVATRLLSSGTPVATLNRSGRSVAGATALTADLGDPTTLTNVAGATTVIFTTAPPTPDEAGYRLAYLDGPQNLLQALGDTVNRVVVISTTGVYGVNNGSWVSAATAPSPDRATTALVAEGEAALCARYPTTIVRAAGIYGPGRTRLIDQVRSGTATIARDGAPHWTNRIHRDDLADAVVLLAEHQRPPEVVIAVDNEPAPRDDVLRFIAERTGSQLGTDPETRPHPTGKRCQNDALVAVGWQPRYPTFREGYERILASLHSHVEAHQQEEGEDPPQ